MESQFPEARAIRDEGARAYRAADAAFLAGVVDLLYGEGLPFRDVQAMARSAKRADIVAKGAAWLRLGSVAEAAPATAIPSDAVVRPRATLAPKADKEPPDKDAILRELMACVRLLSDARDDPSS